MFQTSSPTPIQTEKSPICSVSLLSQSYCIRDPASQQLPKLAWDYRRASCLWHPTQLWKMIPISSNAFLIFIQKKNFFNRVRFWGIMLSFRGQAKRFLSLENKIYSEFSDFSDIVWSHSHTPTMRMAVTITVLPFTAQLFSYETNKKTALW